MRAGTGVVVPLPARKPGVHAAAGDPEWAARSVATLSGDVVQLRFNARLGVAAILAWLLALALSRRDLLSAQLNHPARAFVFFAYVLATVFFPVLAVVWHPGSPWFCVVGACVLGVVLTVAVWPAQRRFYERMRRRAAMRPPAEPVHPQ
jgi:hypothetical protein